MIIKQRKAGHSLVVHLQSLSTRIRITKTDSNSSLTTILKYGGQDKANEAGKIQTKGQRHMDTELHKIIQSNIQDVIAVLDYHFRNTILTQYKTAENLKKDIAKIWNVKKQDNKALIRYMGLFPNIISLLVQKPRIGNRQVRIVDYVIKGISAQYRIVGKKDVKYRTGKEYHRRSFILINPSHLDELMKGKVLTKDDLLESHYTKRQCKLIRKVICRDLDKPNDKAFVNDTVKPDAVKPDVDIPTITHHTKPSNEDDIYWTDVYDKQTRRIKRIETAYLRLKMMANEEKIPVSMVNRFVSHFGLGKGKMMASTSFCYNGDMERKADDDKVLANLICRIENDIYPKNKAS